MKAVVLPMRDARAMEKVDRFMVGVLVSRVRLLCRLTVNGRVSTVGMSVGGEKRERERKGGGTYKGIVCNIVTDYLSLLFI